MRLDDPPAKPRATAMATLYRGKFAQPNRTVGGCRAILHCAYIVEYRQICIEWRMRMWFGREVAHENCFLRYEIKKEQQQTMPSFSAVEMDRWHVQCYFWAWTNDDRVKDGVTVRLHHRYRCHRANIFDSVDRWLPSSTLRGNCCRSEQRDTCTIFSAMRRTKNRNWIPECEILRDCGTGTVRFCMLAAAPA